MERSLLSAVVAYKFLRPGAIGPFSRHPWPVPAEGHPGEWVTAPVSAGACRDGVHACERRHLPRWNWEELWEVELDGDVETRRHKLRAPRGRLLRRVETWSMVTAQAFARACAERAADHAADAELDQAPLAAAMAADGDTRAQAAEATDDPYVAAHGGAVSAYIAAMTALRVGGIERHEAERDWQVDWLTRELGLRL